MDQSMKRSLVRECKTCSKKVVLLQGWVKKFGIWGISVFYYYVTEQVLFNAC